MTPSLDRALAEFASSGSEEAFRRIVTAYLPLVTGTAIRRTGGRQDLAEDIVQTVFIDLARAAKSMPREMCLAGWLFRHTTFVSSKALRSERRRMKRERIAHESPSAGPPPSDAMAELDDLLLSLPDESRQAVLLHCVEGRTHDEVGAALGISRAAAQKRVERALAHLRTSLGAGATLAGLTAALAPPVARAGEVARRIADGATTAGRGLPKQIPPGFWSGAFCGAAAGLTLAAVPLALSWNAFAAARAEAGSRQAAAVAPAVPPEPWSRRPDEVPAPTLTVDEYVTAVLALPKRYGFSEMAVARAKSLARQIPPELIQDAIVTLAQRMPESMRLTTAWPGSVFASLCTLWSPRSVSDDFLVTVRALPEAARRRESCLRDLAKASVRSDPQATRELLHSLRGTGHGEEWSAQFALNVVSALAEAVTEEALQRDPPEALAVLTDLIDQSSGSGASRPEDLAAALDRLRQGVEMPGVRESLIDSLEEITSHRARAILEPLVMTQQSLPEWQRFAENVADPGLRAVSATAASLVFQGPSKSDRASLLAWWETQVAPEHLPAMASELARGWPLDDFAGLVSWLDRIAEPASGATFDRLRAAAAENLAPREGDAPDPPRTLAPDLALRIVDPNLRMAVLASVMRAWKGPEADEWMRRHLPPEVAADLAAIANPPW